VTERDFDYRRGWIESLLAYLAGVFALDVGNFNILSNHLHALLRTRPDLALRWSAEEVAWRWKRAWPELCDGQWVREPTDAELDALLAQPTKIEQLRSRLSSLSWFMARWKEPIARVCNSEMDTSGHFWEGRFHSRELLDEEAVLTCSFYVDLNQVRAGLADSLLFSVRQRRTCLLLSPACRLAPASHSAAGRSGQLERRVSESSEVF
jgi:REP element-mobilizing transposase RayT